MAKSKSRVSGHKARAKKVGVTPGARFGYLVVKQRMPGVGAQNSKWRVECDCGKIKIVPLFYLTRPKYPMRSCGCTKFYGVSRAMFTGWKRERSIWFMMHRRCYYPDHVAYKWYGGSGIGVSPEWNRDNPNGFANFCNDMGHPPTPLHTLDRINPFLNYGWNNGILNCQWATPTQQANNQKRHWSPERRVAAQREQELAAEQLAAEEAARAQLTDAGEEPQEETDGTES